jgi:predicted transcriptional regulator
MKLKLLTILFQSQEHFFSNVDQMLKSGKGNAKRQRETLVFDSVKTFNTLITVNKIQILRAISQLKPESVYQLALLLGREAQHVLKDCRQLESLKFIKLERTNSGRNALKPLLTFDYDVIKAESPIISPYTISELAEKYLLNKQTAI